MRTIYKPKINLKSDHLLKSKYDQKNIVTVQMLMKV